MFSVDELLSKRNQREAMAHFANKRDSRGADGMKVSELSNYWQLNGDRIIQEIKTGVYEPAVIEQYEILNAKGKRRVISNLAVVDRFITRLISQKLRRYLEQGRDILVEIDLKDFFDTIPLEMMIRLLEREFTDEAVLQLIKKNLYCKIEKDNCIESRTTGLVQGNSFSPVLSIVCYLYGFE